MYKPGFTLLRRQYSTQLLVNPSFHGLFRTVSILPTCTVIGHSKTQRLTLHSVDILSITQLTTCRATAASTNLHDALGCLLRLCTSFRPHVTIPTFVGCSKLLGSCANIVVTQRRGVRDLHTCSSRGSQVATLSTLSSWSGARYVNRVALSVHLVHVHLFLA